MADANDTVYVDEDAIFRLNEVGMLQWTYADEDKGETREEMLAAMRDGNLRKWRVDGAGQVDLSKVLGSFVDEKYLLFEDKDRTRCLILMFPGFRVEIRNSEEFYKLFDAPIAAEPEVWRPWDE